MVTVASPELREILLSLARSCGQDPAVSRDEVQELLRHVPDPFPVAELGELLLVHAARFGALEAGCIYLSTPITTGESYLARLSRGQRDQPDEDPHRAVVVDENRMRSERIEAQVRKKCSSWPSINPAWLVDVPGWGQDDYHTFWVAMIDRYACKVVLADGWQHSTGCCKEFLASVRLGLPLFDERLHRLPHQKGYELLDDAMSQYGDVRQDAEVLSEELRIVRQAHIEDSEPDPVTSCAR